MYLTKTFKLDLYDCKVQIIITDNATKSINKIYKKHNTGMVYKDTVAGLMLTLSMNHYYIIIDSRFFTYNTICHELYHLTQAVTYDRSIWEEESRAWVQGLLAQHIFDFINTKKLTIG